MSERYPHTLSSLKIGPITVRNRLYIPPHGTAMSFAVNGDYAAYLEERVADGGPGLVIQSLSVAPVLPGAGSPYHEANVSLFSAIAELMHRHDTKVFGQLHYWWGVSGGWDPSSPRIAHMGPSSAQRFETYETGRAMTEEDINGLIAAYRQCAVNLRDAGYDGLEVHAAHGMVAEQFLSPYWNHREDRWGGSFENRVRLLATLLETCRDVAGDELAVGVRFNCDEMLPGGYDSEAARGTVAYLHDKGLIDFADLDVAVEPNQFPLGMPNYQVPKFLNEGFAANVRTAAAGLPVLCALGRANSVADAERALESGSTDLVGIVRGLMAEPRLLQNAVAGNERLSRTCTACNYCMDRTKIGFNCAVNPATGRERRWGSRAPDDSASNPRRVVVVGAGPAGLEAARVAAERGHTVTLLERNDRFGGQYLQWVTLPDRDGLLDAITWYDGLLQELGVDVRLETTATADDVLALKPDAVLVATGARYDRTGESGFIAQPIPGWDRDFVYTPEDILERGHHPGGQVIVLDDEGFNTGVGIAEVLATAGSQVEIVTRWLNAGHNTFNTFELPLIMAQLNYLKVQMSAQHYVKSVGDHTVTVFDIFTNREQVRTDVDAVVLATRRVPDPDLTAKLEGCVEQLFPIGDALGPRDHGAAFYEGQYFARLIGATDAPRTFTEALYGVTYDFPGTAADYVASTKPTGALA